MIFPDKKTVYLDHSHLCEAYKGLRISGSNDLQRNLNRLVTELSKKNNLCFSFTHILELARWNEKESIDMAAWLDSLENKIWIKTTAELKQLEMINALGSMFKIYDQRLTKAPFCVSLSQILTNLTIDSFSKMLQMGGVTISNFTRSIHSAKRKEDIVAKLETAGAGLIEMLHDDRNKNPHIKRVTEKERDSYLKIKSQISAAEEAIAVYKTLNVDLPYNQEIDNKIRTFFGDINNHIKHIPFRWLYGVVVKDNLDQKIAKLKKGSRKYNSEVSSIQDWDHLAGAAYCDVFTCDTRISKFISNSREKIGKGRQLSYGKNSQADFIKSLECLLL